MAKRLLFVLEYPSGASAILLLSFHALHFRMLQGVPVFKVKYGAFGEVVDALHEYVLSAITSFQANTF